MEMEMKFDAKKEEESFVDYFVRIGKEVNRGGMTWNEATVLLNKYSGSNVGESAYRKRFKNFYDGMKYQRELDEATTPADELCEIRKARAEMEREKVKYRDERNEWYRVQREAARAESFRELLERCVVRYESNGNTELAQKDAGNETDDVLIVHLTDLHLGAGIDNAMNRYNAQIAENRLALYLDEIKRIAMRHNAKKRCVLCITGDIVSGIIHANLRLENNENVIMQTIHAASLLSSFVKELAECMVRVDVFFVGGNHGRVMPAKEDNQKGENFDLFIPFYMKAKLENVGNVVVYDNDIDESIAAFECCGKFVVAVHGDKDSPDTIVQKMALMLGRKPDLCLLGHRHSNGYRTVYDTKVVESGCICGTDNYAIDKRIRNRPEQTVIVFNQNGIRCIYDIQLDE